MIPHYIVYEVSVTNAIAQKGVQIIELDTGDDYILHTSHPNLEITPDDLSVLLNLDLLDKVAQKGSKTPLRLAKKPIIDFVLDYIGNPHVGLNKRDVDSLCGEMGDSFMSDIMSAVHDTTLSVHAKLNSNYNIIPQLFSKNKQYDLKCIFATGAYEELLVRLSLDKPKKYTFDLDDNIKVTLRFSHSKSLVYYYEIVKVESK